MIGLTDHARLRMSERMGITDEEVQDRYIELVANECDELHPNPDGNFKERFLAKQGAAGYFTMIVDGDYHFVVAKDEEPNPAVVTVLTERMVTMNAFRGWTISSNGGSAS